MGRCVSSGTRGGGTLAKVAADAQGNDIDLSDSPLRYGGKDSNVSSAVRSAAEAQETKRLKAKVEYAMVFDENGNPRVVGAGGATEKRGGGGSVRIYSSAWSDGSTMTHNHPRSGEPGVLGGTFSSADVRTFVMHTNAKTMRASASEGTYSLTRLPGMDNRGFASFARKSESQHMGAHLTRSKGYLAEQKAGRMTYQQTVNAINKSFNQALVGMHNDFIAGQKQYGYSYTLEKRG